MTTEPNQNVAARLSRTARLTPTGLAIVEAAGPPRSDGSRDYRGITFEELDGKSDQIARGLIRWGVQPGMRIVLAVPFGAEFIQLTFALLKANCVPVLVDPGMGRQHLVHCLREARPDGFMAIPKAQAIRTLLRGKFPAARFNVTVGRRLFWGGRTLRQIEHLGRAELTLSPSREGDDAAVIFTTGSTGPPKGVRYSHQIFNNQIDLIRERYQIRPGSRDLACFPLFGLFDCVMGVTTIIPDMDPTRPADVNPQRILEAVDQWEADQAFGSPALWNTVSRWCLQTGNRLSSLRRVLSAGAPVPPNVLTALRQIVHPEAEIFTPYGSTEALPIASIESRTVLDETAAASSHGKGTCVGSRFQKIQWKVISIHDGPAENMADISEVAQGEIGELMVSGPVVTSQYVTRPEQNALHKVSDGERVWHRMGDVGYLDEQDRFWFCGRKSHRVQTTSGTLYTVPCEAIFNAHPAVYRSALVGIGPAGAQHPVLIVEPQQDWDAKQVGAGEQLITELTELAENHPLTAEIKDVRIYPQRLPVDIRHNSKIFREQLAVWAAGD